MNTPCTYYFILSNLIKFSTNKVRNQLRLIHSRTLDAELTFQCTRPVTYQIQEVAGELFESEDFASHLWRLRVCFQIGSDRKFRKSQISISKQMYRTVALLMEKININSLDFYFGELTRTFHFAKNLRIKAERSPRRTRGF